MDSHQTQEKGAEPPKPSSSSCPTPSNDEIESICSEFESVELTEEETAALLSDAMALNKRLKEELRRQERRQPGETAGEGESRTGGGNRPLPPGAGGRGVGRRGDAVSASLPPINPKRGLSVHQRRIYNLSEPGPGPHQLRKNGKPTQRKTHSANGGQRPSSSGHPRTRGTQSAESKQKPEWNDRFSF